MSSAMVTNWEVASRNGSLADMHRSIKQFKELRPYYMEDYYPLTGINDLTAENVWLVYQLNRPSDNSGIVMAFRRSENGQNEITVQLKGLTPDQTYVVRNDNDGTVSEATGKQLSEGIALKIDAPRGSLMLQYAPKK
jgi:alpha-galactosidase